MCDNSRQKVHQQQRGVSRLSRLPAAVRQQAVVCATIQSFSAQLTTNYYYLLNAHVSLSSARLASTIHDVNAEGV